ncbi:hypothetical protein [Zhaonella formicivorans]|uniref:hypothetical protein n=1 Tax=Zhaonella formicivorans TaxID=2528593 RepID=UPI0010DAA13B|nr:hypothetical protein [Zhaonella formicivorans]
MGPIYDWLYRRACRNRAFGIQEHYEFIYAHPFSPPLPNHHWWYISNEEVVGIATDENKKLLHVIHGILGKYRVEDQPYQGKTGYKYFRPLKNTEELTENTLGFWEIHIDPETGLPLDSE